MGKHETIAAIGVTALLAGTAAIAVVGCNELNSRAKSNQEAHFKELYFPVQHPTNKLDVTGSLYDTNTPISVNTNSLLEHGTNSQSSTSLVTGIVYDSGSTGSTDIGIWYNAAGTNRSYSFTNSELMDYIEVEPYKNYGFEAISFECGNNKYVKIKFDGTVELPEGMPVDAAALNFWKAMTAVFPLFEQQIINRYKEKQLKKKVKKELRQEKYGHKNSTN